MFSSGWIFLASFSTFSSKTKIKLLSLFAAEELVMPLENHLSVGRMSTPF